MGAIDGRDGGLRLMSSAATLPSNAGPRPAWYAMDGASRRRYGFVLAILGAVGIGSLGLYPVWREALLLWETDPLRSIGAAFPLVALAGVLAAWRRLGWNLRGSWWGLLPIAISLPLARISDSAVVAVVLRGHEIGLLHPGVVFFLYAGGAVLLFGGWKLLRSSLAPLCLLLAVNPVPYAYNSVVDLPLQELSANTARAFAHLIGLRPTGEQLKMMFAPDFGMIIVPGCNGVRGSVTFAYLALVFGYMRGMRPRALAIVTALAFGLGYALNLLRLCVLVIYYRIGLSFPAIQDYGVGVDYAIGCTIFLLATLTLGVMVRSLAPGRRRASEQVTRLAPEVSVWTRFACFAAVALVFLVPQVRLIASAAPVRTDLNTALGTLPAAVGPYRLTRSYFEQFGPGVPAMVLGDYVPADGDRSHRLTLGLWVAAANHQVAGSRSLQGARLLQSGPMDTEALLGLPVHFATSTFDDGVAREFNAEANCSESSCADHIAGSQGSSFVFRSPGFRDMLLAPAGKRLPINLQRQWTDGDPVPSPALRSQFETDVRLFTSQLDLASMVRKVGSRP